MPKFSKDNPPPGKGRPPGSKNKASEAVALRILSTVDELDALRDDDGEPVYEGGYLLCTAREDAKTFATLLGRCLPKDMNITHSGEISYTAALAELEAADRGEPAP